MSLNMNNMPQGSGGGDLGSAQEGVHPSCLIGIIDLGVQPGGSWKGKPKPPAQQLILISELLDDQIEINGVVSNRIFSTKVWAKAGEKAKLTKLYKVFDPDNQHGGDLSKVLGTYYNLSLRAELAETGPNKGQTFIKFESAMSPVAGQQFAPITHDLILLDQSVADVNYLADQYRKIQPWMREAIKAGLNYSGSLMEQAANLVDNELAAAAPAGGAPQPQTQPQVQAPQVQPQATGALPGQTPVT